MIPDTIRVSQAKYHEKRMGTYRRVLKTMTTMSTKNPRARGASCKGRKERGRPPRLRSISTLYLAHVISDLTSA